MPYFKFTDCRHCVYDFCDINHPGSDNKLCKDRGVEMCRQDIGYPYDSNGKPIWQHLGERQR